MTSISCPAESRQKVRLGWSPLCTKFLRSSETTKLSNMAPRSARWFSSWGDLICSEGAGNSGSRSVWTVLFCEDDRQQRPGYMKKGRALSVFRQGRQGFRTDWGNLEDPPGQSCVDQVAQGIHNRDVWIQLWLMLFFRIAVVRLGWQQEIGWLHFSVFFQSSLYHKDLISCWLNIQYSNYMVCSRLSSSIDRIQWNFLVHFNEHQSWLCTAPLGLALSLEGMT